MNRPALVILCTLGALTGCLHLPPARGPVRQPSELETMYRKTGAMALAYHLFRRSATAGAWDDAEVWLDELVAHGWRMGIDPSDMGVDPPSRVAAKIERLRSHALVPEYDGDVVQEIGDPLIVPESLGHNRLTGELIVGSLRAERLVSQEGGTVREIYRRDSEQPAAIFGLKIDPANGDIIALVNRYAPEPHGAVLVLSSDGKKIMEVAKGPDEAGEFNDLCLINRDVFFTDGEVGRVMKLDRGRPTISPITRAGDLLYPNGVACTASSIYVSDAVGISRIDVPEGRITRMSAPPGISLGGIDGLYAWRGEVVGVQNALGTPKIIRARVDGDSLVEVRVHDLDRPEFRIPTTGFIEDDCLYYIANSSLDALAPDWTLDPNAAPIKSAKVIGLNLLGPGAPCKGLSAPQNSASR